MYRHSLSDIESDDLRDISENAHQDAYAHCHYEGPLFGSEIGYVSSYEIGRNTQILHFYGA